MCQVLVLRVVMRLVNVLPEHLRVHPVCHSNCISLHSYTYTQLTTRRLLTSLPRLHALP